RRWLHGAAAARRPLHPVRLDGGQRPGRARRAGDRRGRWLHSRCAVVGPTKVMPFGAAPGWPVVLRDGPVLLRPYRRSDAAAWSEVRRSNRAWLAPWEPSAPGDWNELNSVAAYRFVHRDQRKS